MTIQIDKLAHCIKQKRGRTGLRKTAEEIGEISASTLSRVEQGRIPDLETFVRICSWLGMSTEEFIDSNYEEDSTKSTPEIIEVHLRADRTLEPEMADALMKMVRLAYKQASQGEL